MVRTTFDPEKFNLNLVRLKRAGDVFEVVVNPDEALAFRRNQNLDIKDVLKSEKIFSNAQRGLIASESVFEKVFGTTNILEVAKKIVCDGEIRLTAEFKRAEQERKKTQLIGLIQRNCIDPRTNTPHTISRIEMGLSEAKIKIDEFKPAEAQFQEIVSKLQSVSTT
jgi:ribosome maturation protein SDO1